MDIFSIKRFKPFAILALLTISVTFLLWLPFILHLPEFWGIKLRQDGMAVIVENFDGPYYIVVAKTLYNPKTIENNFSFPLQPIYYSSHYPLFPVLIRLLGTFMNYPYAMMVTTLITTVAAIWMFYILLGDVGLSKHALWLASLFTFFPGRWLITHSVGSPEPLFLFAIMASVFFFRKKKWLLAGVFGAIAQLTKSPAILLFVAYGIALIAPYWPKIAHTNALAWVKGLPWRAFPLLLIPLTLVLIFTIYGITYNNFVAYFNSGDNIHLMFPPFKIFNPNQTWVGTFWLEEIIWIYLFGLLGTVYLIKQKRYSFASFVGVFFFSILFVSHRDIARYSLPIVPFLFIAFSKVLASREFKWIILILLIPLYLFSLGFINNNLTPISDWGPLL